MKCSLCRKDIDTSDPDTWKAVVGWVGGPKKDSMRLRQDVGMYAHDTCIQAMMAGQAPDQPTLFDLEAITSQPGTHVESLPFEDEDTARVVPMVPVDETGDIPWGWGLTGREK